MFVMQTNAMKACFQIAEGSFSFANLSNISVTSKYLAKGKYAQAVRKAALASIGAKAKKDDATKTSNYPYKFEWNLE